jgi:hypothetical protein
MIADKSRCAILVYALLAVRTIALGTLAALAINAVHISDKHIVLSGAQVRQIGCTSVPQPAQPHKHLHDPFASMLLG